MIILWLISHGTKTWPWWWWVPSLERVSVSVGCPLYRAAFGGTAWTRRATPLSERQIKWEHWGVLHRYWKRVAASAASQEVNGAQDVIGSKQTGTRPYLRRGVLWRARYSWSPPWYQNPSLGRHWMRKKGGRVVTRWYMRSQSRTRGAMPDLMAVHDSAFVRHIHGVRLEMSPPVTTLDPLSRNVNVNRCKPPAGLGSPCEILLAAWS